eukprot:g15921.t1
MMTVTQMISQLYQQYQVQKAWEDRDKIEQEMKLFEHVHEKYKGPGENAILLEIAKRKNQLELAKLYEAPEEPEPVEDHEELIEQYEKSTEDLIDSDVRKKSIRERHSKRQDRKRRAREPPMHKTKQSNFI